MSFHSEFRGIKEIAVDGEVYVNKEELMDLIRGEQKRYREGTEPGYLNLKKKQAISVDLALNHLKVLLCKRFYDQLRADMFQYLIAGKSDETGTLVYFSHWCMYTPDREGQVPVFVQDPNEAHRFDNREMAQATVAAIHADWPEQDIGIVQFAWTFNEDGLKKIHSFLGWPDGREMEQVLKDEISYLKKPE